MLDKSLRARCLLVWFLSTTLSIGSIDAAESTGSKASGEIIVRVVRADGRPQEAADVEIFSFDQNWRVWNRVGKAKRADPQGRVKFDGLENNAYLMQARQGSDSGGAKEFTLLADSPRPEGELLLGNLVVAVVRVRDGADKPIASASIHDMTYTGANGGVTLPGPAFPNLGFPVEVSDAQGELRLPPLVENGSVKLTLMHPDYAPCKLKDIAIHGGRQTDAVMAPGVRVTFQVEPTELAAQAGKLMLDLRHEPFDHPSTLIGHHLRLGSGGTDTLTVAEGEFGWVRLTHPDFVVTPIYCDKPGKDDDPIVIKPGQDKFTFALKPKVRVRGRVIDKTTGKAPTDVSIEGEVQTTGASGPLADYAMRWTHVDWADVDSEGRFEIKLAAGPARLSAHAEGYIASQDHITLDVVSDGSTVAPDLVVRPMPKLRGVVTDPDGRPVPGAVVRFSSWGLRWTAPVATDREGRFELSPPWVPQDSRTEERQPLQSIVAFHPLKPLAAKLAVRLDEKASPNVEVQLKPQGYGELIAFERDSSDPPLREKATPDSLDDKPAPELHGLTWLNTEAASLSLNDFRGKYVLLDFWTTWCGPCHADFPAVKLLHDLYKDKGFVVVGVHDNSMPLEAIRADVTKEKLAFPIVVDHPDGRIVKAYGVASWPTYLLIGPDGKIIHDDHNSPGPSLRVHKIEIVREALLSHDSSGRGAK
jgi:thiol-disulfide isomerase/thioredoxin